MTQLLAADDQKHRAKEHQGHQQPCETALGVENQVDAEHQHADETADDGAEESVAAVELGLFQIAAHAKNGTDAGKGRTAIQEIID